MSRIGRMPIAIPAGVTVDIAENNQVTVKGPKGTLERVLPAEMTITKEGEEVKVTRPNDLKKMKSLHGLTRTLINNMIIGVTEGYEKRLEVNGVGYRAAKQGKKLTLSLGYSHPVEMEDIQRTFRTSWETWRSIIRPGIRSSPRRASIGRIPCTPSGTWSRSTARCWRNCWSRRGRWGGLRCGAKWRSRSEKN